MFKLKGTRSGAQPTQMTCVVAAGTEASISVGSCVTVTEGRIAALTPNAGAGADDSLAWAASVSTETAANAGTVEVVYDPELMVSGKVSTPGNLTDSIRLRKCTMDIVGGEQLVDEDAADGCIGIHELLPNEGEAVFVLPFQL